LPLTFGVSTTRKLGLAAAALFVGAPGGLCLAVAAILLGALHLLGLSLAPVGIGACGFSLAAAAVGIDALRLLVLALAPIGVGLLAAAILLGALGLAVVPLSARRFRLARAIGLPLRTLSFLEAAPGRGVGFLPDAVCSDALTLQFLFALPASVSRSAGIRPVLAGPLLGGAALIRVVPADGRRIVRRGVT